MSARPETGGKNKSAMSDIFREVDEDLRHERYKRLWDRFGVYVIGLAVVIVLGVSGYKAWATAQPRFWGVRLN
mgnify:CR=1 FL=1